MKKKPTPKSNNVIDKAINTAVDRAVGVVTEHFDHKFSLMYELIQGHKESADKRFDSIDKRFDSVDKKFDSIDKRFDSVDKKFDSIDKRFDSIEENIQIIKRDVNYIKHDLNKKVSYDEFAKLRNRVGKMELKIETK